MATRLTPAGRGGPVGYHSTGRTYPRILLRQAAYLPVSRLPIITLQAAAPLRWGSAAWRNLPCSVTGQWVFDRAPDPPFLVKGVSGLVVNLDADLLDGEHASAFADASHVHAAADITSGQLALTRGGTNADLSATGGAGQVVTQTAAGQPFSLVVISTILNALSGVGTGALLYRETPTNAWVGLAKGTTGYVLQAGAVYPQYVAVATALSEVLTTRGDLLRFGASAPERLALGTTGQVLTSDGTDAAWATPSAKRSAIVSFGDVAAGPSSSGALGFTPGFAIFVGSLANAAAGAGTGYEFSIGYAVGTTQDSTQQNCGQFTGAAGSTWAGSCLATSTTSPQTTWAVTAWSSGGITLTRTAGTATMRHVYAIVFEA